MKGISDELIFITICGQSDSGFTKRRTVIRLSEIEAIEEESQPIKGKRRTIVHTKTNAYNTTDSIDEVIEKMQKAYGIHNEPVDYGEKEYFAG